MGEKGRAGGGTKREREKEGSEGRGGVSEKGREGERRREIER